MGRTDFKERNQTVSKNPVKYWLEWDGAEGHIKRYDTETKENEIFDLPFPFLLLEIRTTVKGFKKIGAKSMGAYSNESQNPSGPFHVKWFDGNKTIANGLWRDIRDLVKFECDGKYTRVLYVAIRYGDAMEIAAIKLQASSLAAFSEFEDKVADAKWQKAIQITEFTNKANGGIKYRVPVFEIIEANPDSIKEAEDLYESILKPYFLEYDKNHEANGAIPGDGESDDVDGGFDQGGDEQRDQGAKKEETYTDLDETNTGGRTKTLGF